MERHEHANRNISNKNINNKNILKKHLTSSNFKSPCSNNPKKNEKGPLCESFFRDRYLQAFVEEDFFPLHPLQLPFAEELAFPLVVFALAFLEDAFALAFEVISALASIFAAFFLPNIVFPP